MDFKSIDFFNRFYKLFFPSRIMNKKGGSPVVWFIIIFIFILLVVAFVYTAYVIESRQIQNESLKVENNTVNFTEEEEVEVYSDVGGLFKIIGDAFS